MRKAKDVPCIEFTDDRTEVMKAWVANDKRNRGYDPSIKPDGGIYWKVKIAHPVPNSEYRVILDMKKARRAKSVPALHLMMVKAAAQQMRRAAKLAQKTVVNVYAKRAQGFERMYELLKGW